MLSVNELEVPDSSSGKFTASVLPAPALSAIYYPLRSRQVYESRVSSTAVDWSKMALTVVSRLHENEPPLRGLLPKKRISSASSTVLLIAVIAIAIRLRYDYDDKIDMLTFLSRVESRRMEAGASDTS